MNNPALRYLLFFVLGLLLAGCAAPTIAQIIDLDDLSPLPTPATGGVIPLRVAVAAVISPQGTVESYSELLKYLEDHLDRPVELVQRASYAETNDLLEEGEVDLAFVCTGAYLIGVRDFGMKILVAPEVNGEAAYHSWLIVPAGSPATRLEDLRDKTFAFTDPLSNTGRMYPIYLLQQMGETPESFFRRTFYTYSHDAAIKAVADGVADGAAVDHLIFEYLLQREPQIGNQVRVIHRSPAFGIPPVVVSPSIRPQLYAELQELFLAMDADPVGQAALDVLDIDRFVLLEDEAYDTVRLIEAATNITPMDNP
jgi:phosphonate transport system substrate-binding protein